MSKIGRTEDITLFYLLWLELIKTFSQRPIVIIGESQYFCDSYIILSPKRLGKMTAKSSHHLAKVVTEVK